MTTPVIELTQTSLTYRVVKERPHSGLARHFPWASHWKTTHGVKAVREIDLKINHGETVGVIGSNGAGKSTLLRLMAGILKPSSGTVQTHGTVSTLLSLGVGFRPQLTGRENAVLAGLAAGITKKDVLSRIDSILDFADIGEFADLPVRTYSSGMNTRLGFAVASSMTPDILLIDEALSAGDAEFKSRAQERIRELITEASTLVLVSHSMKAITDLCDRVIWVDRGQIKLDGSAKQVTDAYTNGHKRDSDAMAFEDF